jgi:N-acetylglucosaminyldiphosphoundecaprenol N-acetyl-beta-D-mannosaminyltransferase
LVNRPCIGVGAAFDFMAGVAQEAPQWIQNSGLEWLFRLVVEPKRLWRRYLIGNMQFLSHAVRQCTRDREYPPNEPKLRRGSKND